MKQDEEWRRRSMFWEKEVSTQYEKEKEEEDKEEEKQQGREQDTEELKQRE